MLLKNYYEFKADGTYVDSLEDGYVAKLEALYANLYEKRLIADAEAAGLTVEEVLSSMGYTKMENYIADILAVINIDEIFPGITEGTYKIADKKLSCTYEYGGTEITETMSYTITSSKLTFTDSDVEGDVINYPMTYNKIA